MFLLQNYYYLVQSDKWRLANDWIHVDEQGKLQPAMVAYKFCGTRHIRQSLECCGFLVKAFFEANIDPHLDRMKSVQPETEALRTVAYFGIV